MARSDLWTHGINTILESPELATVQRRSDIGTVVEQDGGTSAWFHVPIPTPSVLDGDTSVSLRRIMLAFTLNRNAKLERIHVRRGKDLVVNLSVSLTNIMINNIFECPDAPTLVGASSGAGMTISLFVHFLPGAPRGRFEMHNAGAMFS